MTNSQNPFISVVIITWNRRQYVLRAIESVFKQPYRPIEVVVADSASTDGTAEDIEEAYPEVRVIRLHRNMGCPEGRNVALANCTGEIIFSLLDIFRDILLYFPEEKNRTPKYLIEVVFRATSQLWSGLYKWGWARYVDTVIFLEPITLLGILLIQWSKINNPQFLLRTGGKS